MLKLIFLLCLVWVFALQGKLPLTGMIVTKLEDCEAHKNAFELNGIHHTKAGKNVLNIQKGVFKRPAPFACRHNV